MLGLFILSKLADKLGVGNVGLYWDDGLALIEGTSGRNADKASKNLYKMFQHASRNIEGV